MQRAGDGKGALIWTSGCDICREAESGGTKYLKRYQQNLDRIEKRKHRSETGRFASWIRG